MPLLAQLGAFVHEEDSIQDIQKLILYLSRLDPPITTLEQALTMEVNVVQGQFPAEFRVSIPTLHQFQDYVAKVYADKFIHSSVPTPSMDNYSLLTTGCTELDAQLALGGWQSSEFMEIIGKPGAGKTQVCLTIAAQALLDDFQIFYYTNQVSATAKRLGQILKTKKIQDRDIQKVFNNLKIQYAGQYEDLYCLLMRSRLCNCSNDSDKENVPESKPTLVVIDPFSSYFLPAIDVKSRKANKVGYGMLHFFGRFLCHLASRHNIGILATTTTVTQGSASPLGAAWSSIPDYQTNLEVNQTDDSLHQVSLLKGKQVQGQSFKLKITDEGTS